MAVKRYYIGALAVILLFGGYPIASAFLASLVANAAGCRLDESQSHSCIIWGFDYGERLYGMAMSSWLMLFTLPAAELAIFVWAVVLAIHLMRRRLRRSAAKGTS